MKGIYVLLGFNVIRVSEIRSVSEGLRPFDPYSAPSLQEMHTLFIETFSNNQYCKSYQSKEEMEKDKLVMIKTITGVVPNQWMGV